MKRHMQPTEANRQMTERYSSVNEGWFELRAKAKALAAEVMAAQPARRATVAGMPTTPAWYGAKPKGGVSK